MMKCGNDQTIVCPNCYAEWTRITESTWEYDNFPTIIHWNEFAHGELIPAGQRFCPACAESSADAVDRMGFIKAECLERDFLEWLLSDAPEADVKAIFSTLVTHAPEMMETRMEEFVADQAGDEFTQWRCGA